MKKTGHARPTRKSRFFLAPVAVSFVSFLLFSAPAFAQCEPPGVADAAKGVVQALQQSSATAEEVAEEVYRETALSIAQEATTEGEVLMEESIDSNFGDFSEEWDDAWRDMTKQMSDSDIDQDRQLASFQGSRFEQYLVKLRLVGLEASRDERLEVLRGGGGRIHSKDVRN